MEVLMILPGLLWALVPLAIAVYALVLLLRMSRVQEQILRKLESVEQVVRQR